MSQILKVSESFHSIQGEGEWTGVPMHFIRLAGCNVGRHPSLYTWELGQDKDFPILKTGKTAYVCHTYDGRIFYCDTDFQSSTDITFRELFDNTWESHICITGGEPLLHWDKLSIFVEEAHSRGIMCHVESSGTIKALVTCWLTISPKAGYLEEMITWADEIKLLIDDKFKLEEVPSCIQDHKCVFIQPVNDELTINPTNLNLCREVQRAKPNWKLSVQLHKCFNWR